MNLKIGSNENTTIIEKYCQKQLTK